MSIKYYQGYYRVKIIYEILKKCPQGLSLYKVFECQPGFIMQHLKRLSMYMNVLKRDSELNRKLNDFITHIQTEYFVKNKDQPKEFIKNLNTEHKDLLKAYELLVTFWETVNEELK